MILIVAGVRIVTLDAIAHRRRMHSSFKCGRVFVRVATQAKRLRSRSDQFDASHVLVDPNFVTAQASGRDGGMNRLPFRLVLMALQAFGRVDILIERNRMLHGPCGAHRDQSKKTENEK